MTKPPRVRHSKAQREPMTIDLDPASISRVEEPAAAAGEEAIAETAASEPTAETGTDNGVGPSSGPDANDGRPETAASGARSAGDAPAGARPSAFGRNADAAGPLPPSDTPRRGSGLISGLAGGAIALLAAGGLNYAGLLPLSVQAPDAGESEAAITALRSEIETLKADVAALRSTAPDATGVEELRQALADQASRVDGLASGLETLRGEITTLREAVEAGGAGDGAALQALEARIRAVESLVASLGEGGGVSDAQLAELSARIATVESAASAANAAAASAEAGTAEVATRLTTLEQTVAGLASRIDSQGEQPKVALAIAAAALRAALDRGGTFTAEVETFAAIAPDSPDLPALREAAAAGVVTRAELIAGMPDAADAMIDAGRAPAPDAGFWERLWDSLKSLVSVRPIGAMDGPGVPETVSRIEAAVRTGDLARALAEYDTLPETAKAAGQDFAARLRTRHDVEQLVEKALAEALKAT